MALAVDTSLTLAALLIVSAGRSQLIGRDRANPICWPLSWSGINSMPFLRERSGRWSPVKIVAFAVVLLPALWIAWQGATDELGPRPITEAIHQLGDWALRLLWVTLAITPAQRVLHYPRIILARRTLGVAAASYACLHISMYVLDQHFDVLKVASEIVLRVYLLIGFLALTGLIALAATSTDAAISRLGTQRWNSLHRLVYAIALLASVHFFMQSKLNIYEPVLMAGFLAWLLAFRLVFRRRREPTPLHLLFLAGAVAVATAAGEATIYMLTSGVDAHRVLLAHFDLAMEVRPAWWVLAAGLAVAAAVSLRYRSWRYRPTRTRTRSHAIASIAVSRATRIQTGS
jgi:methionine sulfoxide reductase heme-binding subunit